MPKKKGYWSLFDLQTKSYLASGRNSPSKKDVILDGIDFLASGDVDDSDLKEIEKMNIREKEEVLKAFELLPTRHRKKLPEVI